MDIILTQNQMNIILNYYNNTRYETLTEIILKSHPELKSKYINGISSNDINIELEQIYIVECKKYNLYVMLTHNFQLNKRENINITSEISKLFKKRSIFDKNNYTVF